ncbi:MAG: SAM-dependent DNA methyltransferase, partial [Syntrophales bacterium]
MPTSLSKELRKLLENTTKAARVLAESACRAALENLAVHEKEYRAHMSVEQRLLRNRLRARGRALGDKRDERSGVQDIHHLSELAAYEHWHRLLFTRFLTENHLLIADEANGSVPVTLEECEELAPELDARDGLDLACRFASLTLPGVFRSGDPVLDLPIALNDQVELRELLGALPSEAFCADDALGWTYQFWQAKRKKEVNDSGKKIGADELSPVTQLFTEDYMVEFLLHNTLGAWWAGKIGPITADTEEEARAKAALPAREGVPAISWTYLRFIQDETIKTWLPAAGTFGGWPKSSRLIRLLDPCMGSGHFLVFALPLLVRLRMEEENLSAQEAVVAVLKDNIHGLELDERCTQIAAFNVALTAWKLAGYQALPSLNMACSGLAPSATKEEWMALAGDNYRARNGMARLHSLFKDAPVLGSLINPRAQGGDLIEADFHELAPLLKAALAPSDNQKAKFENDSVELAVIAQGLTKAAELLAAQFTLVITNVPYLGRRKQDDVLKDYCERIHPEAKADLATCFIERSLAFCAISGSATLLVPQNWLFLGTFEPLRKKLLHSAVWNFVCRMGSKSFQTPMYDFGVVMHSFTTVKPNQASRLAGFDVGTALSPEDKSLALPGCPISVVNQLDQLRNPGTAIVFEKASQIPLLSNYTDSHQGAHTFDVSRFRLFFWEMDSCLASWNLHSSSPSGLVEFSGYHFVSYKREEGNEFGKIIKEIANNPQETRSVMWRAGHNAWGKLGVACAWMGTLPVSLYIGQIFDNSVAVIIPKNPEHLLPVYCFCSSPKYLEEVRKINQKTQVADSTLVKVPFDLANWQKVAEEEYPNGLPKPFSNDPTQWLFNSHPRGSDQPLHVAVARLLGYRWPRQT